MFIFKLFSMKSRSDFSENIKLFKIDNVYFCNES